MVVYSLYSTSKEDLISSIMFKGFSGFGNEVLLDIREGGIGRTPPFLVPLLRGVGEAGGLLGGVSIEGI